MFTVRGLRKTSRLDRMATLTAIAALCTCSAAMVPSAMAGTILSGDSFIAPQAAPFDPALFVGNSTAGSAAVTPPVTGGDTYSAVVVGQGGTGNVTVTGSGAAGSATLTATNIVDVGATTTGSLTISNGGAVVSQGGPSPFCITGCSATTIGNGAGANGTVTVTGANSSFTVSNSGPLLVIGNGRSEER